MPGKPHHQILVYNRTVWEITQFGALTGTQRWFIYHRVERLGSQSAWWEGLVPNGFLKFDMKNQHLPKPILKAYLFSEWTYDTPQVPNGTTLWVEQNPGVEVGGVPDLVLST